MQANQLYNTSLALYNLRHHFQSHLSIVFWYLLNRGGIECQRSTKFLGTLKITSSIHSVCKYSQSHSVYLTLARELAIEQSLRMNNSICSDKYKTCTEVNSFHHQMDAVYFSHYLLLFIVVIISPIPTHILTLNVYY